ncbi:hypothetical protein [Haloarchaeobius sp. TZWSO28]|uniref:hypothetical protein n=1 Tax=Haloarchaeobius sp. TZWSO28 TaxID=3446119 RepID=UPI003EBCD385
MSSQSSTSTTTDVPERRVEEEATFGEKIEELPVTVMFFAFSFGILLFALVIDTLGYAVLAGVLGATAVVFMVLAVVTHAVYFLLGILD